MKKLLLLLCILISQAAQAEWMQGFYRVTCVPEIGYFEVSPHWVSGPSTENLDNKTLSQHGLHFVGRGEVTECFLKTDNPKYSQKIKVVGYIGSPFFDLFINDKQMVKRISFRTQHPVYGLASENRKQYEVEFIKFVVNGTNWSFKAFIRESVDFQIYHGSLLHLWGDDISFPISYKLIESEYLN